MVQPLEASTYTITPSVTSIAEGGLLITTISTTNVAVGTKLYFTLSGSNISTADFSAGFLIDEVIVGMDGSATLSHTLANDFNTEGTETLEIKLFADPTHTVQLGTTATVLILDSSTATPPINPTPAPGTGGGNSGGTAPMPGNGGTTTPPPAPTYTVSTSTASINEGGTFTTTISTTNVAVGTKLYFTLSGSNISTADFSAGFLIGEVTVGMDGSASLSHTLANDFNTEGTETLEIKLFADPTHTVQLGTTATVLILDSSTATPPINPVPAPGTGGGNSGGTAPMPGNGGATTPPPAPTYTVSTSTASINEGGTFTTTISTTNVAVGTKLYFTLSGSNISTPDFSAGFLTGEVTVGMDGSASLSHTLANDFTTEGTETLEIRLFSDPARGTQVGSTAFVQILDTSTTPAPINPAPGTGGGSSGGTAPMPGNDGATTPPPAPTYTVSTSTASINEGGTLTTTISTTNLPAGTVLYYSLSGPAITQADLTAPGGALPSDPILGQVTIGSNGIATLTHTLLNDSLTEGTETLEIRLFSDPARGTQVGSTAFVQILDTSTTPAPINPAPAPGTGGGSSGGTAPMPASYSINPMATSINEGGTISPVVTTYNVPPGTILYYELTGTGITSSDFSPNVTAGQFVIGSNGQGSFSITLANDQSTEGQETLEIRLFADPTHTVQLGTTATVLILDSSTATPPINPVPAPGTGGGNSGGTAPMPGNDGATTPPPAPTYTVSTSTASINEGGTLTTTISTTNLPAGTVLYYSLSGPGITQADWVFASPGVPPSDPILGQVTIGSNGIATLTHTLLNDSLTEGTETLEIRLFSDPARGTQVGSTAFVQILDTSTTPAPINPTPAPGTGGGSSGGTAPMPGNDGATTPPPAPTYTVSTSTASINEGGTLTTTISTTNLPAGTVLYYSLTGPGITQADWVFASPGVPPSDPILGQVTIGSNGIATLTHTLLNDSLTEGTETLEIRLFSDPARGTQVGSTAFVQILDTSTTPAPINPTPAPGTGGGSSGGTAPMPGNDGATTPPPAPTYTVSTSTASINEGGTLTTTISTTNLPAGTVLYYSLTGPGITQADWVFASPGVPPSDPILGQVTIGSNGIATLTHTLANDSLTEGIAGRKDAETLEIRLFSDPARGTQVGSTALVQIIDTSTTTATISNVADNVGAITGTVAEGGSTDDTTPTLSGTLSAPLLWNETLRVFNGTTDLGAATAAPTEWGMDMANTWSFTPSSPLADGTYSFTVRVMEDIVGNLGAASPVRTLTIATTAPTTPAPSTAPILVATSEGLVLKFSAPIQAINGTTVNPAAFSILIDGKPSKVYATRIAGSDLALTLWDPSLLSARSISVSYLPPANDIATGILADLNGNRLAAFSALPVNTFSSNLNISTSLASSYANLILTGTAVTGFGNDQDNTITGNDGNNILNGLAGADTLRGGKGDDTYVVDSLTDLIIELANEGSDTVESNLSYTLGDNLEKLTLLGSANLSGTGNSLDNLITGNAGNNILDGAAGNDTLIGKDGDDTLIGGLGDDILKGGAGNDTYVVDSLADSITDTSGYDTVMASVSWTLGFNLEALSLSGNANLNGTGNSGKNTITGNNGNNILDGLRDTDILTGLAGADTFRFSTTPTYGVATADHITDFQGSEDRLEVSRAAFGIASSASVSLTSVNSAADLTAALASSALFVYDSSNGSLFWNQNGSRSGFGTGGIFAVLDNHAALNSANIALI